MTGHNVKQTEKCRFYRWQFAGFQPSFALKESLFTGASMHTASIFVHITDALMTKAA